MKVEHAAALASRPAAAPLDDALAPIVGSLDKILSAPDALNDRAPAYVAFSAAIRRQGRILGEMGGAKAMRTAMRRAAELAPERARVREAAIDRAWAGLPGWRA